MYLLYLPFFLIEIFLYKFFNKKNSEYSYQFFLKLYATFGGLVNKYLSIILSNKKNDNNIAQSKVIEKFIDSNLIAKKIFTDGHYFIKDAIKDDTINEIIKFTNTLKGKYISEKYKSEIAEILDFNNLKAAKFSYSPDQFIENKIIQEIILDEKILNVSSSYLNCAPVIDNIQLFWSFAAHRADKEAAQYWHFDMDRPRWIKIFLYLTDCNELNGPHKFIERTHLMAMGIKESLRKKGYTRLEDREIEQCYSGEQIKTFTAKKGSILFEDTSGLHKGQNVIQGSRLMLIFQYSSSLFGSHSPKIKMPKNISKIFLDNFNKNKKMFNNFY